MDYKLMYYYLLGRMESAVDVMTAATKILNATSQDVASAITELKSTFENIQQKTESMFYNLKEDDVLQ